MKRKAWKWSLLAAAYTAAFAANVGTFAWSWKVQVWQAAVSILYAAACVWVFLSERKKGKVMRLEMAAGVLTAAAGLLGLLVRAAGLSVLTIPALLLSGVLVTPLYGLLGLIPDYDVLYGAAALLGLLWFAAARFFRQTGNEGKNR